MREFSMEKFELWKPQFLCSKDKDKCSKESIFYVWIFLGKFLLNNWQNPIISEQLVLWRLTSEVYHHFGYTIFLCTPGFILRREKNSLPPLPPTLPGFKSLRISSVPGRGPAPLPLLPKYLDLYDHLSQEPCNIARGMLTIKVKNHGIVENENIG